MAGTEEPVDESNSRRDSMDVVSLCAVALMLVGIGLCIISWIYPNDVTFDATLPAETMETLERRQQTRQQRLDALQLVGVVFVATGALTQATLLTVMLIRGDFLRYWSREHDDETQRFSACEQLTAGKYGTYDGDYKSTH